MSTAVFITQAEAENRIAQKEWNARTEMGLADVFKNFPSIVPSPESRQLIIDWCDRFLGYAAIPSAIILKTAKDNNPQAFREAFAPHMLDVQRQRQEIIGRILVLLATGGNMSEHDLQAERRKLHMGFTRDQLLNRERMITEAQRLAGLCKAGGVQAVKDERSRMRGDNEPQLVVLLPPEWTPQTLKRLATTDLTKFRKLVAEYGEKQINDRLAGRS